MVKLIPGLSGSGKTRRMINNINEALKEENGILVCIEKGNKLTYDLNYRVRLIEYGDYQLEGLESLKAFISGLHAGNFDITHVYLRSIHRLLGTDDPAAMTDFCDWCRAFGDKNQLSFTMTARIDPAVAPEALKRYI